MLRSGVAPQRYLQTRPSSAELQTVLLGLLGRSKVDPRLGRGQWYLSEAMAKEFALNQQPKPQEIMKAVWSLISQGLAYIDYSQPSADNWTLHLTLAGKSAANDQTTNPDSPDKYIHRLQHDVPNASDTVLRYVNEALVSYLNRSYLASAVMLGVASEADFLEMAEAFGHWLPSTEGTKFLTLIRKPNAAYLAKFEEYRKKLEPRKPDLPEELADGMALTLDAIVDLLRIYRNEAGHPRGKQIGRDQAKIHLEMFARYVERMYAFKAFFERMTN
jgi:hypothetical protein